MSYMPNQPKKRPVYTASADIMKRASRGGRFSDMPFETMEVGQSFVVQESEGFTDKELRCHVSTRNGKNQRKFRVKWYKDQGFWEVCRMPDDFKFVQGRKSSKTGKNKTAENEPNLASPLPWGQQLGHGMGQE